MCRLILHGFLKIKFEYVNYFLLSEFSEISHAFTEKKGDLWRLQVVNDSRSFDSA